MGFVLAPPGRYPIQKAIVDSGLMPGPGSPPIGVDDWMKKLGSLPLLHQPGEKWLYHTGSDVLGVLIARVSGQPFPTFLQERIFAPLGMKDTAFHVPREKLHRLPSSYVANPATGKLVLFDDPANSRWGAPPTFPSGGGGLVSTVDDYLAFCRMMLRQGSPWPRAHSVASVRRTDDHRSADAAAEGRCEAVLRRRSRLGVSVCRSSRGATNLVAPGRFGWDGGAGTSGYTDPAEELIGILMTQRMMDSPTPPKVFGDFWTAAYRRSTIRRRGQSTLFGLRAQFDVAPECSDPFTFPPPLSSRRGRLRIVRRPCGPC